jgi:transposase
MYLEGIGFRGIGRLLSISFGTVYQWARKWGEQVSDTDQSALNPRILKITSPFHNNAIQSLSNKIRNNK